MINENNSIEIVKIKRIEIPIELIVNIKYNDITNLITDAELETAIPISGIENSGNNKVPIWEKMALTTKEAAAYSGIGINRIDKWAKEPDCKFVLWVGTHKLIKRKQFEEFVNGLKAI